VKTTGSRLIVLDASVVLALAFMEPGWDAVLWGQDDLCISSVCLVEVVSKLLDRWPAGADIHAFLDPLAVTIAPLTDKQALVAGLLRQSTRSKGLSLGDRCCLALAKELRAPVMTADRAWVGLDVGVEVRVIR
jgi:ribonuclease VapC